MEQAAKSNAWVTAAEWREFLPFIEAECPGISADILPILAAEEARGTTLFMGPGVLAGGTIFNGKGNTPPHVGYLLQAFIEHCPSE